MANDDLAGQRQELQAIRAQLAGQHEKLVEQKGSVEQWAVRRQEEVEAQAARLVAREQELDHQEAELESESIKWQTERLGYHQEIQHLKAELRRQQPVAV